MMPFMLCLLFAEAFPGPNEILSAVANDALNFDLRTALLADLAETYK